MALFDIIYQTSNYYTKPVREAVFELMVLPENMHGQKCQSFHIQNSLDTNSQLASSFYGARLIRFRIPRKFCSFQVTVKMTIEKDDLNPFHVNELMPEAQEEMLHNHIFKIDNHWYLSSGEFTAAVKEILPKKTYRIPGEDLFNYMQRVNNWVFSNISYQTGVTTTLTKLDDILRIKAGVCQDQAHLFIAIMRANGIPSRYVSGYLNQGKSFTGSSAMHAWAEAFLPGVGWIGFDPSNNLLANVHYIKIGHGLDYADCMPIKGVLVARGNGFTEYSVKVTEQQTQ